MELLEIKNLKLYFDTEEGIVKALENVNLMVKQGKIVGIVGETGSGKSVTALSVLRLIPQPPAKILAGEIWFNGVNLLELSEKEMDEIRGSQISMIFQEPMTSLNPTLTIGEQIVDVIRTHMKVSKSEAIRRALELLRLVRMHDPETVLYKYSHELSGGMRQRAMIAMALSCNPKLLIADEPTTALDVTIQAQILGLIKRMNRELKLSVLLITHNFGIVAQICDAVAVMYAGYIVEYGSTLEIFANSMHPYTRGLLRAIPPLEENVDELNVIPGAVPNLIEPPSGCRFHPRCERLVPGLCEKKAPELSWVNENHSLACFNPFTSGDNNDSR